MLLSYLEVVKIISKEVSKGIKGLAIIMVIISHIGIAYKVNILYYLGPIGVTWFLFLSGYGLTKSYEKNGLNGYFQKRFKKVMMPYLAITFLWFLVEAFLGKYYSFIVYFLTFIGFDYNRNLDPTMWYISLIILWYLFFFLIFRCFKSKMLELLSIFIVGIVLFIFVKFGIIYQLANQWSLHSLSFPIGAGVALYENRLKKYFSIKNAAIYIIAMAAFALIASKIVDISRVLIVIDLASIIAIFILIKYIKPKFIEVIGDYSYEIYLVEGYLIFTKNLLNLTHFPVVSIAIYLSAVIMLAFILKKITNPRINTPNIPINI